MTDEWCPENDGAYRAEMAALHRDGVEHRLHKARAEIERLTKQSARYLTEAETAEALLKTSYARIEKAEAERDEARILASDRLTVISIAAKERDDARSMLADAERDMRQRAADAAREAWRDGYDATPHIFALPLKHADRENDAAFAQGQKEGAER